MGGKRLTVRVTRVVERTKEQAYNEVSLVRGGKVDTGSTSLATAKTEFEWDAPLHFSLVEGEALPEELRISVRGRMGHSGTPEVLGFGSINVKEALGNSAHWQGTVPLSRHHKRNMEAETVITEHSGDAEVVVELE